MAGLGISIPGSVADENSLESTKGGLFISSCAMMTNTYFIINNLINFIIKGPAAQANSIKSQFESIEAVIDVQIEKLNEVLVILNDLLIVDVVDVDEAYLNWFSNSPYIRRIMGEYTFHATYETLRLVDANVAPSADALRKALIDQAIAATQALLAGMDQISFDAIIDILNRNLIPVLFEKSIAVPLPDYMYPQVTTNSRFRIPGDAIEPAGSIGVETSIPTYVSPEFPIPDPTDTGLDDFLASGDLQDLTKPLANQASYTRARAYWTSNWRPFNIPGINGSRVGIQFSTFFPEIDEGEYGPTLTTPLNHRTGHVSAFAVTDNFGVTLRMEAWRDLDTGELNPNAPTDNAPAAERWSFMDLLYELHEIVLSIDGVCTDAPSIIEKWTELLTVLGISQFIDDNSINAQYMNDHMPTWRINQSAVLFGSNIVQAFGAAAIAAQDRLAAKIIEVEDKLRQLKNG